MFFSDAFIEEVKLKNDIVDVISQYVRLEKKGKDYFGLCPFHNEKTPSFSVVPNKQIFFCFGCGKGGNVINFISQVENLDFVEAVKFLAKKVNLEIPEVKDNANSKEYALKKEILEINKEAARFFYSNLMSERGVKAQEYLKNRKLGATIVKRFGLGYAVDSWDDLYTYISEKGFSREAILNSGLFSTNKNGKQNDRYRDRLIFPIFDVMGNVIAFGGRKLDDKDKTVPKYINSPETLVYTKGNHLFALNFAKDYCKDSILIVEGYMDVISLHQSGFMNAIACLGTALTDNQARLMNRYTKEIILCYDTDEAGTKATNRGIEVLRKQGMNPKVLRITDGKDPDEFIKQNGKLAFTKEIQGSKSFIDFKIEDFRKKYDLDNIDQKAEFLTEVSEMLAKVENPITRELYVKKLAEEFKLSEDLILKYVNKEALGEGLNISNKVNDVTTNRKHINSSLISRITYQERLLMAYLCINNSNFGYISKESNPDGMEPEDFVGDRNKEIFGAIMEHWKQKASISPTDLLDKLHPEEASYFSGLFAKDCEIILDKKGFEYKMKELKVLRIEYRIELLRDRLTKVERDDEKTTIMMELNKLYAEKKIFK